MLNTGWHKHPGPGAWGIDPHVGGTASTPLLVLPPPPPPPCPLFRSVHTQRVHLRVPLPRPSCLMRAETYVWGDSGKTECPENAVQIGSEEECERGAVAMGRKLAASSSATYSPSGCFGYRGGSRVFFNTHPVGAVSREAMPLCAVGTASSHLRATCRASCTVNGSAVCTVPHRPQSTHSRATKACNLHRTMQHRPSVLVHVARGASRARGCRTTHHCVVS
jgi:hypothetical protein